MKTILHRAETRGHADHGWLNTHHTFSFAGYHNPDRMNFGALRVLNDDIVAPGMGFGKHPHDNMEIVSIPLQGDLEHQDSMGNKSVIREGDIQVMSAGTGVFHSEYNPNNDKETHFLQIWLFPRERNLAPRYDQISIREVAVPNRFYQILSPNKSEQGVWINQDAWFSMAHFDSGATDKYTLKRSGNGVYVFVLEGCLKINNIELNARDGLGVTDIVEINVSAVTPSKVLLMELPM